MSSAPVEFRPFKLGDIKAVYEIEKASFPRPWPKFSFLVFHYREPQGFKVAAISGQIIGYSIVSIEPKMTSIHENIAHLVNLAVHPDFRRRKIGRRLIEGAITYAAESGVDGIELEVNVMNQTARELYLEMGFVEKNIIKDYYEDGEDAIIMTKRSAGRGR
jgi:[ribosomal protein S18]-alanine N-acetyltransferase